VRIIIQDFKLQKDAPSGLSVQVDIKSLIEKIYVSPNAPDWYFELVQKIVFRYRLEVDVTQSSLSEQPIF